MKTLSFWIQGKIIRLALEFLRKKVEVEIDGPFSTKTSRQLDCVIYLLGK